jgi:clan AA aspartic protease (TIGR02281 family)
MRSARAGIGSALVWLTWGLAAASAAPDLASPEGLLEAKGLKRAGATFVLADEAVVQRELNQARRMYQGVVAAAETKSRYEQDLEAIRTELSAIEEEQIVLGQQMAQAQSVDLHNRLVVEMNARTAQINAYRQRLADADSGQGRERDARFAAQREAFIEVVLALRPKVDKTLADYAGLDKDDAVKTALVAVGQTLKTKLALGPSRAFTANVKQLVRYESMVLSESVPLRAEGGVHWVDVTFNGKVTRATVFDTGAATVVLPADLAKELGLKPLPGTAGAKTRVADGSEVEVFKAVIPSVRVGKFIVKDVECAVMPPDKANVAPLLGQTFLHHFTYKTGAGSSTLVLSKIDTPKPQATAPKSKTGGRSTGARKLPRKARAPSPAEPPE